MVPTYRDAGSMGLVERDRGRESGAVGVVQPEPATSRRKRGQPHYTVPAQPQQPDVVNAPCLPTDYIPVHDSRTPVFKFVEGAHLSKTPPGRSMSVEGLIHNLTGFADFYEQASADIDRAQPFEKPHHRGGRDANADYYQRCFRATPGIDRVRAYVLSCYGEELTIGAARRVLGDLIRVHKLSVEEAGKLSLEAAMDRLEATNAPGGAVEVPNPHPAPPALRGTTALPASVRNWLTARYLADPTPGPWQFADDAEPEPAVFVRYEDFAEYLLNAGIEILPNLDTWRNAGWIEDVHIDLAPTNNPTDSPAPLPRSVESAVRSAPARRYPPNCTDRANCGTRGRKGDTTHRMEQRRIWRISEDAGGTGCGRAREVWSRRRQSHSTRTRECDVHALNGRLPEARRRALRVVPFGTPGYEEWERRVEAVRSACADLLRVGAPFHNCAPSLDALGTAIDRLCYAAATYQQPNLEPAPGGIGPKQGVGGKPLQAFPPTTKTDESSTTQSSELPAQANLSLLDQAKRFLAEKELESEAREVALRLLPYMLFPPNGPFGSATGAPVTMSSDGENASPPATGTEESEGDAPEKGRPKRTTRAEAEVLVRDWLTKHAKDNPAAVTRDAVAAGTGVSAGTVSNTAAWQAFRDRRDAESKPGARNIPLSDQLEAVIPHGTAGKAESEQRDAVLNKLIEEQEADAAEDNRRQKRRHKP